MNLKQAARRLGVHYQTAYRYVRTGRLVAVRVGHGYEISEAALAHYFAQCEAAQRAPIGAPPNVEPESGLVDDADALLDAALSALAATSLSSAVPDVVAAGLSTVVGDLAMVRPLSRDGRWLGAGSVHHRDPRRRSIALMKAEAFPNAASDGPEGRAIATLEPVVVPYVRQDQLRAETAPELVHYLDEEGVHSLVCAPAISRDQVLAVVTVSRDRPGCSYTPHDVALVVRLAAIVGAAIARTRAAAAAWQRRRELMAACAELGRTPDAADVRRVAAVEGTAEVVCDTEGRILYANDEAGRLGRITSHALVGRFLQRLSAEDEQPSHRALIARLLQGDLSYADTTRIVITRDGSVGRVAVYYGTVRKPTTETLALVVVAHRLAEPEMSPGITHSPSAEASTVPSARHEHTGT